VDVREWALTITVTSPVWGLLSLAIVFRARAAWRSLTYTGWYEAKR
jgi:hypothetical protein